jgi:hypothetical protein
MFGMEATHLEYIGLALFVASELIGMSRLKSNSLLQIILSAAMRAFPHEMKKRPPVGPGSLLDSFRKRR